MNGRLGLLGSSICCGRLRLPLRLALRIALGIALALRHRRLLLRTNGLALLRRLALRLPEETSAFASSFCGVVFSAAVSAWELRPPRWRRRRGLLDAPCSVCSSVGCWPLASASTSSCGSTGFAREPPAQRPSRPSRPEWSKPVRSSPDALRDTRAPQNHVGTA